MKPELQKYYESRFSMMSSEGWSDLMDDLEKMIEATDRLGSVDETHSIDFRKGELSIMHWLKNLQTMSRTAFEELKDEES